MSHEESGPGCVWSFPLPRTHTGIVLGNGTQGLMVWGGGSRLNITVGRAGFWDHRFGNAFSSRTTFRQVRRLLEAGDEAGIRAAFAREQSMDHPNARPHQVGGGRLEVTLPEGWQLDSGVLSGDGAIILWVLAADADEAPTTITIRQAPEQEVAWLALPESLRGKVSFKLVPSWAHVGERLAGIGCRPPREWRVESSASGGFEQPLPEDDPLAIAYCDRGDELVIASALGQGAGDAATDLAATCELAPLRDAAQTWWQDYWASVPRVDLPDGVLQQLFELGLHKQACATPPQGVACTLQGPFLEEYQIPPWSCDYHFNINIQMIYWPALATNRLSHFEPLWRLIKSWMPQLKKNAEGFFEAEGALMLPHAVDDRCQVVGTFWTGTIDHACTAWMAQMAWLHYRYEMDEAILREVAWPLLQGAFNGFWAMSEWIDDTAGGGVDGGRRLSLPVSVSPEFKGARMDAWGRDASFQLAAWHCVTRLLLEAADVLGEPVDDRWLQVRETLPPYTTVTGPRAKDAPEKQSTRIALWEGMDLIESHRHHSHLGAISPFCTIGVDDDAHAPIIRESIWHWIRTGCGAWSGWCVPWAAMIHARCNNADGAVAWLQHYANNFTNEGHASLHDSAFLGTTTIAPGMGDHWTREEIMQLDASMGAVTAICEMLVQCRRGVLHVLPSIPRTWRTFSFEGVRCEGAFLVSAWVKRGQVARIEIVAEKGGRLRLAHGMRDGCFVNGQAVTGPLIDMDTQPGQVIRLTSER